MIVKEVVMGKVTVESWVEVVNALANAQEDSGMRSALGRAAWDVEAGHVSDAVKTMTAVRSYLSVVSRVLPWRDNAAAGVEEALEGMRELFPEYFECALNNFRIEC